MKKRITALLLTLALAVGLIPAALAAGPDLEQVKQEREQTVQRYANDPAYQARLAFNREFAAEVEEECYLYTIVTDDVQALSDQLCAGLETDEEKLLVLYQWVTENIYYGEIESTWQSYSVADAIGTAQKTMTSGVGVCRHYTLLFQALCWAQKIPCIFVDGEAEGGHAWNLVKVGDEWLWADATFDSGNRYVSGEKRKGTAKLDYFLCSTEYISVKHQARYDTGTRSGESEPYRSRRGMLYPGANAPTRVVQALDQNARQEYLHQKNKEYIMEALKTADNVHDWARNDVIAAFEEDLVPGDGKEDYKEDIDRLEFSVLMVVLLQEFYDKGIADIVRDRGLTVEAKAFTDTESSVIDYACALGIVQGKGDGTFDPDGHITRQEAAVMLQRTGQVMGLESGTGMDFADQSAFPAWAKDGIAYVSGLTDPVSGRRVMEGTGNGFEGLGSYTKEQTIITSLRLLRCARGGAER